MSARGPDNEVIANTCLPQQALMIIDGEREPRLVLGRESLFLQGFPIDFVDRIVDRNGQPFSECLLNDLAGNMVSVPVFLAMLASAIGSVSWLEKEDGEEDDDETEKGRSRDEGGAPDGSARNGATAAASGVAFVASSTAMPSPLDPGRPSFLSCSITSSSAFLFAPRPSSPSSSSSTKAAFEGKASAFAFAFAFVFILSLIHI